MRPLHFEHLRFPLEHLACGAYTPGVHLSLNRAHVTSMIKIGHISDLHIFDLKSKSPLRFLNKRIVGGANLLFKRSKAHSPQAVERAIRHLVEDHDVDHIAISGDLSNLALHEEFVAANKLIATIPDATERVSVVPGNHDYYIPAVEKRRGFERVFSPYMKSDLAHYTLETGYPYCKFIGDEVALVALNSAIASPPMFAIGEVDERELRALEALLDDPLLDERFVVVMLHHPLLPFEHSKVEYTRRLVNADEVLTVLRRANVDLAIHGHNHYYDHVEIPHLGQPGTLHICEAGSTSITHASNEMFGGKFNIYHIDQGQLSKIETHIFESHDASFKPWRERVVMEHIKTT